MIFLPFLYIISYFKKIKLFWPNFKVGIRPNIRPNIRRNLAEYSVSADTNFRPIGRSLMSNSLYLVTFMNDIFHIYLSFHFDRCCVSDDNFVTVLLKFACRSTIEIMTPLHKMTHL